MAMANSLFVLIQLVSNLGQADVGLVANDKALEDEPRSQYSEYQSEDPCPIILDK